MSAARLALLWRGARRRRQAIAWLYGAPLALLATALAWRWAGPSAAVAVAAGALLAIAGAGVLRARRLDRPWLVRRLDAQRDLEDSADLLFADTAALGPLQRLQRARIEVRLAGGSRDLREPWPWRRALPLALVAIALALLAAWLPPHDALRAPAAAGRATPTGAAAPALREARLQATPPAYTGQPATTLPALDARVPQGTQLAWTLRFAPQPAQVALRLHDGSTLALVRSGDGWQARMTLQRSTLYRVMVDGAPLDDALHKLEALPDRPPQVRVLEPDASLVQWTPARAGWTLRFEASDDYGVDAGAQLKLTLAQGSGENIRFREQTLALAGSGPATLRRFARTLQPQALGMAPGDDLIAQLVVRDVRRPAPQEARSASVILRWPPPEQAQASELEGSVKKALPAYFRSQRQIILDAEALLAQQRRLDAETFLKRADAIGVDQRLLRLRYGQFLGEESEGAPKPPPVADDLPGADAAPTADLPTADAPAAAPEPARAAQAGHHHDDAPQGAAALDEHDHGHDAREGAGFGQQGDVLAEFGHTHDHAEAATLLDPKTRATLKAALDQMWQAEGQLRQGRPAQALPYAYKALDYIKQVQQAERIYLARVGPELPPIDESRRMGGTRDGLARRDDALSARTAPDPQPLALWQALGETGRDADPAALDGFARWLGTHEAGLDDALELAAAVETLRTAPDCAACRQRLRAQLWPLLVRPPTAVAPRAPASPGGRRYLDALTRSADRPAQVPR